MKKLYIFAVAFCLVLLFPFILSLFVNPTSPIEAWRKILGEPEYKNVRHDKSLQSQTRIIAINNRRFEIPLMYIGGQLRSKGEQQNGVNLEYILPDFKSKFELKNKEEYDRLWKNRQFAHMLVQDSSTKPKISESAASFKQSGAMQIYQGIEYGLKKYSNPATSDGLRRSDMYLEVQNKEVVSFIRCSVEGYVPNPGCSHYFYDKGLRYDVYYNKKNYLESWKIRREEAIKFIDSFEIKSGEQK